MAYLFGLPGNDQTLDHEPEFKATIDKLVWSSPSVVYVGWRPGTVEGVSLLAALRDRPIAGEKTAFFRRLVLFEAWKGNLESLREPKMFMVNADVADYRDYLSPDEMSCLIWQDGPEHFEMERARALLRQMQEDFGAIILSTPDGYMAQGALDGNPWEEHKSAWREENYAEIGFAVVKYSAGLIGYWVKDR